MPGPGTWIEGDNSLRAAAVFSSVESCTIIPLTIPDWFKGARIHFWLALGPIFHE